MTKIRRSVVGKKFGRWKIIEFSYRKKYGRKFYKYYKCKCECGNIRVVDFKTLKDGRSKSCGCLKYDLAISKTGNKHHSWQGGRHKNHGYKLIYMPSHHRSDQRGYIREHILIAEKVLGKQLPPSAIIHHANRNRSNNKKSNLVICQDQAYHKLIHMRLMAYESCGNANWRRCLYCKRYSDPNKMYVSEKFSYAYHRKCRNEYSRMRRSKNKQIE